MLTFSQPFVLADGFSSPGPRIFCQRWPNSLDSVCSYCLQTKISNFCCHEIDTFFGYTPATVVLSHSVSPFRKFCRITKGLQSVRSKRLKMVLICVRLIRAYISYCIVQRVGMWRLYRYVIYSNSLGAALFFSSRIADRRAVVKSKHLVKLLSHHSGISASYSPASHYKCKSVTFMGLFAPFSVCLCLFCSCLFQF